MKNKRGTGITVNEIIYGAIALLVVVTVYWFLFLGGKESTYGAVDRIFPGFNLSRPPTEEIQRLGYNLETQKMEYYDGLKWSTINSETVNFRDKSLSTAQIKNEISQKYFTHELPVKFELEEDYNKKFSPPLIYKKEYYIIDFDKANKGNSVVLLTRSSESQGDPTETDIGRADSDDTNIENLLFDVFEANYLIVEEKTRSHLEAMNGKYLKDIRKDQYSTKYIQQKIAKDGIYKISVYEILFSNQPTGIFIDIYYSTIEQSDQETLRADIRVANTRPSSDIENYLYSVSSLSEIYIKKTVIKESDVNKAEILEKNKPAFLDQNSFQKFVKIDSPEQEIISKVSEWRNSALSTSIQITYTSKETKKEESNFYCLQSKPPYLFIDFSETKSQNDKC